MENLPTREVPVLLLHGLFDTGAIFQPMARALEKTGRNVLAPDLVPNNGTTSIESLARQVDRLVQRHFDPGQPLDILGFSMGGMVARYWIQRMGGKIRTRNLICLASPHRGVLWARVPVSWTIARQMRPGSSFLTDLNQDLWALDPDRTHCIWSPLDLVVFPPKSAVLPVGRAIQTLVPWHDWMPPSPTVINAVASIFHS